MPVVQNGGAEYWPIKLGDGESVAEISLIEVGVMKLDPEVVRQRLANHGLLIPVVLDH